MDWKSASEIAMGLVFNGKYDPHMLNAETLFPPYDRALLMARAGKTPSEMIADGIGYSVIEASMSAAQVVKDDGEIQWIKVLEQAASRARAGSRVRKEAEKWEKGDEADTAVILAAITQVESGYREMTPMSEVEPSTDNWVLTGYAPFDISFGGIPKVGMTVMGASPGVGKTSLMLSIAGSMVRLHKEKKVAIFTLEMTMGQITQRAIEISRKITKEEKSRILLSEEIVGPQELYALAARVAAAEPLSLICIDFADQLVEGEQSESIMGLIYRTVANLAKRLQLPVLLLSQLNRDTYNGGIPRINHLRYSGLAEAMSSMILLIYNPHNIFVDFKDQQLLPSVAGVGYVIQGKSRFGYKNGGPGAVQIEWDGLAGWGDKSLGWYRLEGS